MGRRTAMLMAAVAAMAIVLVLGPGQAVADGSWLDGPLTNWNTPGMPIPQAPPRDPAAQPRCFDALVVPSSPAQQALVDAGWFLYGGGIISFPLTVVSGQSNADGMCRPTGYQTFVFVDGKFAGTMSPVLMNSRDDGSYVGLGLAPDDVIVGEYNRYTRDDALCCPSAKSMAAFKIDRTGSSPVIVLQGVKTEPNAVAPPPTAVPSPMIPRPSATASPAPVQAPVQLPRTQ